MQLYIYVLHSKTLITASLCSLRKASRLQTQKDKENLSLKLTFADFTTEKTTKVGPDQFNEEKELYKMIQQKWRALP